MRVALFISIALLTGWISTSSLDTMNRLKAIEKKQETIIAKLEAIGSRQDERFTKQWGFLDEISLEAQQCRRISELNFSKLEKMPTPAFSDTLVLTELASIKKQQDNIVNFLKLQATTPRVKDQAPIIPPAYVPSRKVEGLRDLEKEREIQALEGIESELRFQNTYR